MTTEAVREFLGFDRDNEFDTVAISIASPDAIRSWSKGEIKNPETINYRTFKPEVGGLFCQRIFGPVKDYECACGKYKRIKYKGVICDRCGVEVTLSRSRREHMGHVELAVPISHIWFLKSLPSRLGLFLDMSVRDIEKVIYYESYMVTDPGSTPLKKCQLLQEQEYEMLRSEYGDDAFTAKMGAVAIREILSEMDLEEMVYNIEEEMYATNAKQMKKKLAKRLKMVTGFLHSGSRPEWMILEALPVLPPDLRPLVPLDGGRFATSDLNDLYRRVINRNNRLKSLMQLKTPDVIVHNEMRMLQEAVDALFDNGRHGKAVLGAGNRPLKSLGDMLKGKQGRFRQNLLGKRVDYSGRSVIVIGPELKLHQCGLPKKMALVLFEPFIIRRLKELDFVHTVRSARKMIERQDPEVWDILEEVTREHPILLNRAPTLHRLSIQAFEPILIEGEAIRLHPLVCTPFNADFDGDQMAVHVPLSIEAIMECKLLMMATQNMFSPSSGKPILTPSQDIILGVYYLTYEPKPKEGRIPLMGSVEEVLMAEAQGVVTKQDWIHLANPDYGRVTRYGNFKDRIIKTTIGRVIFNQIFPRSLGFINFSVSKGMLGDLIMGTYKIVGQREAVQMLDRLKNLGFYTAMKAGLSIGVDDMIVPPEKRDIIAEARQKVEEVDAQFQRGIITSGERSNKIIDIWTNATDEVAQVAFDRLMKNDDKDYINPVYLMMDSGARGNRQQVRQLCGMRGLMAKPSGEIIERPILSSFREGLSIWEYFISTHGARKGLADMALKTADAGYMTRKLCDVAMDCIVSCEDDGCRNGIWKQAIMDGDEEIISLQERIIGRCAAEDVRNPVNLDEMLVTSGGLITADVAQKIDEAGVERVKILSPLTSMKNNGIPAFAYGIDPATNSMVACGSAVGIIAAQSIGEPGTQLTMRIFHIGGVASQVLKAPEHRAKTDGVIRQENLRLVQTAEGASIVLNRTGRLILDDVNGREIESYSIVPGTVLLQANEVAVKRDELLAAWDPHSVPIIAEFSGHIQFKDIIPGITIKRDIDETSGRIMAVVIEHKEELNPTIEIVSEESGTKRVIAVYAIPTGAQILVDDDNQILGGSLLAKTPRSTSKTQDITGGLPRVAELFEARRPKEAAEMAKIDGVISFGGMIRNKKRVWVTDTETGRREEHLIPHGTHLVIHEGDFVNRGQNLTEGVADPHEILNILGTAAVQEYLISEVQKVYRMQGVTINDKHIEIIVARMLRKVRITDPGDSDFFWGEQIEKDRFIEKNEEIIEAGGKPAEAEPILLGITKSSLETESFISAASFQETTKVLTDAATLGRVDELRGFKENVIMGHLIPAGSGLPSYRRLKVRTLSDGTEEADLIDNLANGAGHGWVQEMATTVGD
ncbi:MAG: DNA-directed RNA polymerase subunit beta' [Puniceicoccales bacterium]|jgi:DNA-directed RNA polymerase subunit beta'|nr:DNA-directed RNA polymerase subunit beta' [Puniceicoccales bacterium]